MAKARKRKAATKTTVSVQRAPARRAPSRAAGGPVVVVREGVKSAARRYTRRDTGAGGAGLQKQMLGMGIGGFGVGFVEKTFGPKIPTIPMIGRKGSIAAIIYFMKPKEPILRNIGIAAAAIAGYEFGKTGAVSGADVMGDDDDDDDDDD
jgi:hypothetical protein